MWFCKHETKNNKEEEIRRENDKNEKRNFNHVAKHLKWVFAFHDVLSQ